MTALLIPTCPDTRVRMDQHAVEVNKGRRFEFGTNRMRFLKVLNDDLISEIKKSLQKMLVRENLNG